MKQRAFFFCLYLPLVAAAQPLPDKAIAGGYFKARLDRTDYPGDSLYAGFAEPPAFGQAAEMRLQFRNRRGHWAGEADYQLAGQFGDSLDLLRGAAESFPAAAGIQDDSHRLMNLTATLGAGSDYQTRHRLDRLSVSYIGEQWVGRLGRQAVSWGNGLLYNPVDIFNPFDPAAVDTEYKSGDDMAYGQYLRNNGDDMQLVWVVRRDDQRNLTRGVSSLALKYHGFIGEAEYDVLLAEHYDDSVIALGGIVPWGGAVVRGDWSLAQTEAGAVASGVISVSYSWVGLGRNMSGVLEYYYSGFGLGEGFTLAAVENKPALSGRLARGELFTLGKYYLAGSLLTEITPLFNVSSNVFLNLADRSLLAQLVGRWDMRQNWQLSLAGTAPAGAGQTEYGGFDSGAGAAELSRGASVFAQIAFYF